MREGQTSCVGVTCVSQVPGQRGSVGVGCVHMVMLLLLPHVVMLLLLPRAALE